ncbi:MAG TPA: carboxypeptidase regulatory-like domain-containing protein [Longimicrobium sp.]|jgi:hypothetical protein|nr:carboxypeptidase regulatory-like domain-containing protein [Longimicrobium sp.]
MRRHLPIATLFLLALLAIAHPAAAQGRAPRSLLVVRVVDEQGHPLMGARVTVGGVDRGANTRGSGEATVEGIPRGLRLVDVRRQGYAFQRVAADFVGGDTVRREVRMTPSAVELEGLTVTSWGRNVRLRNNGFYDRQRHGFGSFMTRDQIEQLHAYHATDIFRWMRGFAVIPSGSRDIVVTTRGPGGFGSCLPHVYVDGNRMFVRNAREQADALEAVPTDNIEAVEGYQGAASIPAEYNMTGSVCGVLLIWTR